MGCLDNMSRIIIPNDMILDMMKLYKFNGKDPYYKTLFKKDILHYNKKVVEDDTYYFAKIMGLNLTDERLSLIIRKDLVPKNQDEIIVKNIKNVFSNLMNRISDFEIIPNECHNMAKALFDNTIPIKFVKETYIDNTSIGYDKKRVKSKQPELEELFNKFKRLLATKSYEPTVLITNFFVDFYMTKPFEDSQGKKVNELISYVMLYSTLYHYEFETFIYESFFKQLYERMKVFQNELTNATYNWESGYSKTELLHKIIIDCLLECYELEEKESKKYSLEKTLIKTDDVEGTIRNWPNQYFSKSEIKAVHPNVSEKTIERTLERLKQDGLIEPLGTGRSSKWAKNLKLQSGLTVEVQSFNFEDMLDDEKKNK